MGGAYLGGNYWSSYTGVDTSPEDGIGDTAHHADQLSLMPKKYDFSTGEGTDKWAFEKQVDATPPTSNGVPSDEFSDYGNIKTNNGAMAEGITGTEGTFAAHRFNFSMDEATTDIDRINVTWNGKGLHDKAPPNDNGATLYIWNGTAYEELADSGNTGEEVNLTGQITTNIGNYINAGNVTVLVEQNSAQTTQGNTPKHSHIETDYVKLVVHTRS